MMQLMDRASCSEEISDTSLLTHTTSTASSFACPEPKSWAPCHKHSSQGCLSWRHCNHVPLLAHISHLDVFMYSWKRACLMTNPFHVLPDWSPLLVQVSSDLSGTNTPATSRGNLSFQTNTFLIKIKTCEQAFHFNLWQDSRENMLHKTSGKTFI